MPSQTRASQEGEAPNLYILDSVVGRQKRHTLKITIARVDNREKETEGLTVALKKMS